MPVTNHNPISPTDGPKKSKLPSLLTSISLFIAALALMLALVAINKVDTALPAAKQSAGAPAETNAGPNQ